jgi:2-polyprenyl-6-methoxyphenol hydroxylase-like FAD-dependent oxidoreductase
MDALALVSALQSEETVPAALARYEQERLPQGQKIVHQAQRLGSYVRSEIPIEADRTEELDLIMKETAVLDFMQA